MAELFSSLQYIWLNIVFFVFSLFLFAVCLYACLFVRWVYKRRLRQKTDEMIDAYKDEENKRKEMELSLKRQELESPDKKKKSGSKPRKIHIVTKPCNHVTRNITNELIVHQVNEAANDEVRVSPTGPPPLQPIQQQQLQQQPQILNPQNLQQFEGGPYQQPQYVLVPVEVFRGTQKVRHSRSSGFPAPFVDPSSPQQTFVEDATTQTSPGLQNKNDDDDKDPKSAEDWLAGFDERDGERIDVDEEFSEQNSERCMKRRQAYENRKARNRDVDSDETRVSMETDTPPSPPKDDDSSRSEVTSSGAPSSGTTAFTDAQTSPATASTDSPATASSAPSDSVPPDAGVKNAKDVDVKESNEKTRQKRSSPKRDSPEVKAPETKKKDSDLYDFLDPKKTPSITDQRKKSSPPKKSMEVKKDSEAKNPDVVQNPQNPNDKEKKEPGDKSFMASQYYGQPGENTSGLSSDSIPRKPTSPVGRASIFPYFIDPKAPSSSISTSKASSKLTDPGDLMPTDSSCALYRQKKKKMASDSAKIYTATPKTPK